MLVLVRSGRLLVPEAKPRTAAAAAESDKAQKRIAGSVRRSAAVALDVVALRARAG